LQTYVDRVKTIDRMRGICIIYMIFAHAWRWIPWTQGWFFWLTYPFTDLIGACTFTFVAGCSLSLSVRSKPNAPAKIQHLRSVLILAIGVVFNAVSQPLSGVWMWTILTTVGMSRLVGYYCLKTPIWVRAAIIGVIIFATRPLLILLYSASQFTTGVPNYLIPQSMAPNAIIGFILFNGIGEDTFLPYFAFFLAGTIFVDMYVLKSEDVRKNNEIYLFYIGTALALCGIILGMQPTNIDLGDSIAHWVYIGTGKVITEWPVIFSRGSYEWCMLAIGVQFLMGVIFFHFEHYSLRSKILRVFGEFSLTIYITHYIILLFFVNDLPLWAYFFLVSGVIYFVWIVCSHWDRKYKGKYSVEDLIRMVVQHYTIKWMPPKPKEPLESLPDAGENGEYPIEQSEPQNPAV
jgi:hypothetical protein